MVLEKLPQKDIQAHHKIEIHFDGKRTTKGPNNNLITVWDSSGLKTGEGDVLMGFCPGCPMQVIARPWHKPGEPDPVVFFCPKCERPYPLKKLLDWLRGDDTTQAMAEKLAKLFQQLKGDTDVVLKYNKNDIRYQTTDVGQEKILSTARSTRIPVIYTLGRIMDDVHGGADLAARFKAFLEA